MTLGITVVSHVPDIAKGIPKLLKQVAANVSITYAGGTDDDKIGTSAKKINDAFKENKADEILAFYDLGSAKMNLGLAQEMSDKKIHIYNSAFIEGSYTAASLLQVGLKLSDVEKQLKPLKVK